MDNIHVWITYMFILNKHLQSQHFGCYESWHKSPERETIYSCSTTRVAQICIALRSKYSIYTNYAYTIKSSRSALTVIIFCSSYCSNKCSTRGAYRSWCSRGDKWWPTARVVPGTCVAIYCVKWRKTHNECSQHHQDYHTVEFHPGFWFLLKVCS